MSSYLKFIRLPEVLDLTGLSKSTVYDRITKNLFPMNISLGGRAVGWLLHEVNIVCAAMAAGANHEQIEALVINLIAQRNDILEGAMLCNQ